ncbi:MAG: hypothetical protein BMS9Abin37_2194 [Acidobacteriota bacterium]|nr:MAG: hypothetical protein BMS9Abin37_2194 [Acidobacteriota bacterium]
MTGLLLLAAIPALVQEQAPQTHRFRVAIQAVQVDVYVERKGKAVLDLTREDFELFDNGIRQRVELAEVDTAPLSVALVVDASGSMAGRRLLHLQTAAHAFLNGLEPKDQASFITLTARIEQQTELTSDFDVIHNAIDHTKARGATVWHDALYAGLKTVEPVSQRAMVLLFTDGEDTYSWLRAEQLMPLVEQSGAVLYAVNTRLEAGRPSIGNFNPNTNSSLWQSQRREWLKRRSARTKLLRKLAEASGGRLFETPSTSELEEIFLTILAEMRIRYLLFYRPASVEEGWHDVEVKLKGQKADVRARRGYFYEAPAR